MTDNTIVLSLWMSEISFKERVKTVWDMSGWAKINTPSAEHSYDGAWLEIRFATQEEKTMFQIYWSEFIAKCQASWEEECRAQM